MYALSFTVIMWLLSCSIWLISSVLTYVHCTCAVYISVCSARYSPLLYINLQYKPTCDYRLVPNVMKLLTVTIKGGNSFQELVKPCAWLCGVCTIAVAMWELPMVTISYLITLMLHEHSTRACLLLCVEGQKGPKDCVGMECWGSF